jgi:hypothetical protein
MSRRRGELLVWLVVLLMAARAALYLAQEVLR